MIVGAVAWVAIASGLFLLVHDEEQSREARAAAHVWSWLSHGRATVRVELPAPVELAVGDPVFFGSSGGEMTLVGEVTRLIGPRGDTLPGRRGFVRAAECAIVPAEHPSLVTDSRATYISVPQTAAWVMRTLLPPERLAWIANEWNATLLRHREEVFAAISPVLQDLVVDVERLLVDDLPEAIERRREEITRILGTFRSGVIREEFMPLLENELFPILVRRARPTLDAIGDEILARLPVWSLTWRYLYEKLPLTAEDTVQREWNRFVDAEVVPILREHIDDAVGALDDVISEAARNPRVSTALRRTIREILRNRELQHEIRMMFQEIVLDNPRFHDAMWARWRSPEVERAIADLSVFLAPLLRRVGETVLGSEGGGVTPEFARVLRTQILRKDTRWILLEGGTPGSPRVEDGHVFQATIERDG